MGTGTGAVGENSHWVNSLKVIHMSDLEEWTPLDSEDQEELELMLSGPSQAGEGFR